MKVAVTQKKWAALQKAHAEKTNVEPIKKNGKANLVATANKIKTDLKRLYEPLDFEVSHDELRTKGYLPWKYSRGLKNLSKREREDYEVYIMGYLDSFEQNKVPKDDIVYKAYFDWKETKPNEFDLVIYVHGVEAETQEPKKKKAASGKLAGQLSPFAPPPSMAVDPVPPSGPPPPPTTQR